MAKKSTLKESFRHKAASHCGLCIDLILFFSCASVTAMAFWLIDKMMTPDYYIMLVYAGAIASIMTGKLIQGGKHMMDSKAQK